jgi:N-methylhydantoinase A
MQLDQSAAHAVIARVAKALGQSVEEAALSIVRIVDNNMMGALRSVLIERGFDPRDFTLCAFGGATPLHASALIREMNIPRAIVPVHPGQFSAYGFIMTNARVDRQRTTQLISTRFDVARANQVMDELVQQSLGELEAQGYTKDIEIHRALDMRYLGQNYELELPLVDERFSEAKIPALWRLFHDTHRARFGFSNPGEIIEIVNYTVTAVARTAKPELTGVPKGKGKPKPKEYRDVWFISGKRETPIYDRSSLLAGQSIVGPALVEEDTSVTVLDEGHRLTMHPHGHMLIAAVE